MRCLLDKVTARHAVEGLLKLAEGRKLSKEELFSLDLFWRADQKTLSIFVVPQTVNVLQRIAHLPRYSSIINLFLNKVETALPAKYFKRWARRLYEHGFTREDANVLALATFGTVKDGTIIGMHFVATYDQAMVNQWEIKQKNIQDHLTSMQYNIPIPYCHVSLPQVLPPEQIKV